MASWKRHVQAISARTRPAEDARLCQESTFGCCLLVISRESERGLEWRCSDSLSLREFLGLMPEETVPDHSTLCRMRKRFGIEVYDTLFKFVLGIVAQSADKSWEMQQAFYANRTRVRRPKSKALQRKRGELIERTFAHACETGGLRRVRLRGRENVKKRYLAHVAGLNWAIVLRKALGAGTPRGAADVFILAIWTAITMMLVRLLDQVTRGRRRLSAAGLKCIGLFGMEAACPMAFSSTGC